MDPHEPALAHAAHMAAQPVHDQMASETEQARAGAGHVVMPAPKEENTKELEELRSSLHEKKAAVTSVQSKLEAVKHARSSHHWTTHTQFSRPSDPPATTSASAPDMGERVQDLRVQHREARKEVQSIKSNGGDGEGKFHDQLAYWHWHISSLRESLAKSETLRCI